MTRHLKVLTVVGTRPELIRLSRVVALLDEVTDHRLVHTGQNYDYELNEIFFRDLGIRRPDHFLDVDTSSLGRVLGNILIAVEPVLLAERPDAVLVLGDTNSSIAAVMAKRLKIPVYHMEAGNRSFDPNVPEEINRRIIDHLADFNIAYTEHGRRNLLAEGLHPRRVFVGGSPMREVLEYYRAGIDASDIVTRLGLEPGGYFVASVHREENVDDAANLAELVRGLELLASEHGVPVVVSTHPRTRTRMGALGLAATEAVRFLKPFGFFDYNHLQLHARCALSDSGTISEESSILGFPAVTVRNSMERPEALDTGAIMLTGTDAERIVGAVGEVLALRAAGFQPEVPAEYSVRNASQRVISLILGTARLHAQWAGLRMTEPFWAGASDPQGEGSAQ